MNHDVLGHSLEEEYGLRNIRDEWIRRQRILSLDIVKGPISRTNLCEISTGTLPWNILQAHSVQLNVKALVQVEDIINIANADPRSHDAPRVLQLTLNDGAIDFVAIELEPLGGRISLKTTPGTKLVLLPSTLIRRGRVLLTPSDFIFFGSPTTNLWGEQHEMRITQSLRAAGLPNPQSSTFDAIARPQIMDGREVRIPVDMGGIADAIVSDENQDDNDDMFWAQAVEVVERNIERGGDISSSLFARDRPPTQVNVHRGDQSFLRSVELPESNLPANNARNLIDEPPPTEVVDVEEISTQQRTGTETEQHVQLEIDATRPENITNEVLEIPSTPIFESDENPLGPRYRNEEKQDTIDVSSQDAIMTMLDPPLLPFSKLEVKGMGRKQQVHLYRVYSMKTGKKTNIQVDDTKHSFFVQVDDGTAIDLLQLKANVFRRIAGFTVDSHEFQRDADDGFPLTRKAIRGVHGFVEVLKSPNGKLVTSVSEGIPGDINNFLSVFASNVEARLANYILGCS